MKHYRVKPNVPSKTLWSFTTFAFVCFASLSGANDSGHANAAGTPKSKKTDFVMPFESDLPTPYTNSKSRSLTFNSSTYENNIDGVDENSTPDDLAYLEAVKWAEDSCKKFSSPEKVKLIQQKRILRIYSWSGPVKPLKKKSRLPTEMQHLLGKTFPGNIGVMSYENKHHSIDCKSVGFESFYTVITPKTSKSQVVKARHDNHPIFASVIMPSLYSNLGAGKYKAVTKTRTTCIPRSEVERTQLRSIASCYERSEELLEKAGRNELLIDFHKRKAQGRMLLEECASRVETARKMEPKLEATEFLPPDDKNTCQRTDI